MLSQKDIEDKELKLLFKVAKRARRDLEVLNLINKDNLNMIGYCGIGARWLQHLAKRKGMKVDFIIGRYNDEINSSHHCWVEYDGYIIDITATQFGFSDNISLIDETDYRYNKTAKNSKAIRLMKNWPHYQKYIKCTNALKKIHIHPFTKYKHLFT